jgi:hypothetical protein
VARSRSGAGAISRRTAVGLIAAVGGTVATRLIAATRLMAATRLVVPGAAVGSGALMTTEAAAGQLIKAPSGIDPRLRLEYEVTRTITGHPEISGYIYNDYMRAANNVQLLIETLDASGQVIDRRYGFVVGVVPGFSRTPFDVLLKTAGAGYRVTVTSFDWLDGAGGGM